MLLARAQRLGRLSVTRNGLSGKIRKFVVVPDLAPPHNLGVYNNSVDTVARALVERYFLCKEGETFRPALPARRNAFFSEHLCDFRQAVSKHMPNLPRLSSTATVSMFRGPKRKVYEAARLSLAKTAISERDARLSMFSKYEKQDVGKAPRAINPRDPRYNLELARYLKHAEHHFFKAINKAWGKNTRATVIKGFNAHDAADILRAKWDRFSDPVAVGLDATKFDMHVSVRALQYEHSFYRALFPGQQRLHRLLDWQLNNSGVSWCPDGRVKFSLRGTRASGDINTSLGNCILMCAMVYDWCKVAGVEAELANNGDDCVVIMERRDLERFMTGLTENFRDKGFAMEVEAPVYHFEGIEFCQTHPVRTVNGWVMVRNHLAVLQKDLMCLVDTPNDKVYRRWLGAVGECGLASAHGVPVQQAWYEMIRRNGTKPRSKETEYIFKNTSQMVRRFSGEDVVTDDARVSYYLAYGVTPDMQKHLENHFRQASIMPFARGRLMERASLLFPSAPIVRAQVNVQL